VQGFVPHTHLHDQAWRVATFPTSLGGLGYRTFAEVADPAFLASYAHARATLPAFFPWLEDALADPFGPLPPSPGSMLAAAVDAGARLVRIHPGVEELLQPPSAGGRVSSAHHIQKRISALVADEHARLFFQSLLTTREKAYTLSFRQDSHTFSAMPTSPDLTLSSDYFTISVSRRLLLKVTTVRRARYVSFVTSRLVVVWTSGVITRFCA